MMLCHCCDDPEETDDRNTDHAPTLWYLDHQRIGLLAAAGSLGMWALGQRPARLWDLHHDAIEVFAF